MREPATDTPVAAPEWAVAQRGDFLLDSRLEGGWGVAPASLSRGSAYTDLSSHVMAVPEGESDVARAIRFHELAHARYSPVEVPRQLCDQLGIRMDALRIAEEMRINLLTATADTEDYNPSEDEQLIGSLVRGLTDNTEGASADFANQTLDFRQAVYLMYATYGLDVFRTVKRRLKLNKAWSEAIEGIAAHLKREYPTKGFPYRHNSPWAGTQPVPYLFMDGYELQRAILPKGFVRTTLNLAQEIESIIANGGVGTRRYTPPTTEDGSGEDKSEREETGQPTEPGVMSPVPWEALRLGITSLTESTASFMGRRKRPAITGKVPRRPDRLLTDPERRIFTETVRGKGGVVVLDCSGSMGVEHSVVRETVALFAGATVLAYTNPTYSSGGNANAWVLAHGGRMISETDMNHLDLNRGNGCDGEALRWAVRNRRKDDFVLWVSDFGVTGSGDRAHEYLRRDCAELVRRHKIIQVDSCEAAIELLRDIRRTSKVPHGSTSDPYLTKLVGDLSERRVLPAIVPVINGR